MRLHRYCLMVALLLTALAGSLSAIGQGRPRSWRRGPLTMQEFVTQTHTGDSLSHLAHTVLYSLQGVTEGMHTYYFCRTGAVMYPAASWMADGHRDSAELAYNQALFDLAEIYRRQMQWQAFYLPHRKRRYDLLLESTRQQLSRELSALQAATDCGRDTAALERVRRRNREWLNAHPCERPEFTPRPFWWSVGLEFGATIPTGAVAQCFSASVGTVGFNVGVGLWRHGLYLHSARGNLRAVDTLRDSWGGIFDPRYAAGGFDRSDFGIAYGYSVFDNDAFGVTPYVGYGGTVIATGFWYDFSTWAVTVGVRGRYNIRHWHSVRDGLKHRGERLTASATANLFASYSKFDELYDSPAGLTLGLQLGLQLGVRRERVQYPDR